MVILVPLSLKAFPLGFTVKSLFLRDSFFKTLALRHPSFRSSAYFSLTCSLILHTLDVVLPNCSVFSYLLSHRIYTINLSDAIHHCGFRYYIYTVDFQLLFFFNVLFIFGCTGFAARGLSLVVASGGYSSLWCASFSLWLASLVAEHRL